MHIYLTEDEQGQLLILVRKLCAGLEADDHLHVKEMDRKHGCLHHMEHQHGSHHGQGIFHAHGPKSGKKDD